MHPTKARVRGKGYGPEFVIASGVNVLGLTLSHVEVGPGV